MTQKNRHLPKALRESQKAIDASIYSDGFNHGYSMGTQDLDIQKQRFQTLIDRIKKEHKRSQGKEGEYENGRFSLSRELLKMAGE